MLPCKCNLQEANEQGLRIELTNEEIDKWTECFASGLQLTLLKRVHILTEKSPLTFVLSTLSLDSNITTFNTHINRSLARPFPILSHSFMNSLEQNSTMFGEKF